MNQTDTPSECLISIDLGTSKLCAVAVDTATLRPVEVVSCPNDADVPDLPNGHHEQNPRRIWQSVTGLLRRLTVTLPNRTRIHALSISGQMHGVMPADASMEPVGNLITWRDSRWPSSLNLSSPDAYPELSTGLAETAAQRTGCGLHPGYGGATLAWLAERDGIPAGAFALSLAGYIAARLSGVLACDTNHAASWGILDIKTNRWNEELVSRLKIPERVLPPVVPSAAPLGTITVEAAEETGIPEGTLVCAPVGDNQAAVIGAAGFDSDSIVVNLGTGGQVSIPPAEWSSSGQGPADSADGSFETRPMPGGGFIRVGASLCGGWSYAYLKEFCRDLIREIAGTELDDEALYAGLNRLAAETFMRDGSPHESPQVDTRFAGIRGDETIRGKITGIDTSNFTIANLAHGFLRGMVTELHEMAAPFIAGKTRVVASGNAVRRNPLMPKIISDVFGLPCLVPKGIEEAAIGAAVAAALEMGLHSREEINTLISRS